MNKWVYNKDGTIKDEYKHTHIDWRNSNGYIKAKNEREELYRISKLQRKLNNYTDAKYFVQMANEIILDRNSYANWGSKQCRMTQKSKDRISNSDRRKDYTKQIHDRAPRYV